MTKQEQLTLLLNYITKLAKEEPWFKQELCKLIPLLNVDKPDVSIHHDIHYRQIHEIYDYFFRKITERHAVNFYRNLDVDSAIKTVLISDFIKMEFYRRDDKFESFCLAAYQQIEGIVSYYFQKEGLKEKSELRKNDIIIQSKNGKRETVLSIIASSNNAVDFGNWEFKKKLNSVLFFMAYGGDIDYFKKNEFDRIATRVNKLYQGRNIVHRGSPQSEWQKSVINDILSSTERHFLMFLGLLEEFVSKLPRLPMETDKIEKSNLSQAI